ncbi:amino acid/polyamine/organocation transporter (APC superfamily) [Motilibacter rhizosphaerae]|uniref:Amino acid/polyamine/organocation transporter (APC superfamily) n=2 Tax=Motilibacter rhizosphaerae TaxID=598652 RepID=A0A4V2F4N5_9ACTN|nr:amino acid permease [Motilibacter rhizosphaerae]RZS89939.1 amino acid/polyamine/organocation transporter (APC superfamily) [Motilibacter rhizosphaerae]
MSRTSPEASRPAATEHDRDAQRLNELGYAQELKRGMGWFSNFAVSFTIISILTGGITTYYLGMLAGGPIVIIWGWLLVGGMVTLVGAAMAEVCSSYPTAGGLYYWSAKLAPPGKAAVWSWFTGWFNLLGQVAVTASIDFGLANFIAFFVKLVFDDSFRATPRTVLGIYFVVLVLHGLLNTFGVKLTALLSDVSVWWHLVGTVLVVGALFIVPDQHRSIGWVFGQYENETGWGFTGNAVWVAAIGCMLAQYTLTGYDASAHMTEETRDASVSGPKGIMTSIWVSVVAGFVLMLGLTFAIPPKSYDDIAALGTFSAGQIILDAVGGGFAKFLLFVIVVAQFFCGMASVTANSRMIYAFSRDGAVPGSKLWHRINPRTRTPTNSIWFAAAFAFVLGIPSLVTNKAGVPVAFFAIVSVAVVGLYISYVMPVLLRRLAGDSFQPGPWNLGRWSPLIGWAAIIWVVLICFPLLLPQFSPVTASSFNYAPVAVVAVIGFAWLYWVLSARKWFVGPKVQGTPEELAAIERELESLA